MLPVDQQILIPSIMEVAGDSSDAMILDLSESIGDDTHIAPLSHTCHHIRTDSNKDVSAGYQAM
jgi:hypothetical protein